MTRIVHFLTGLGLVALAAAPLVSFAHVALPAGGATVGSDYLAAFKVGHACKGSSSTTALRVQLPEGFSLIEAESRPGWTLQVQGRTVTWTASDTSMALPGTSAESFKARGHLQSQPGTLWFKILQTCDQSSSDWSQIPSSATDKPAEPAARLDVLPLGVAPVDVRNVWMRPVMAAQPTGGVYFDVTAPSGSRLVGAATPVATSAEVHQMSMDGSIMRMRALPEGLTLPAGTPVSLSPGGYHLMLTGMKRTIAAGESVPLDLQFVDEQGRRSTSRVQAVVSMTPPAGADTGAMRGHMH
ncbi:DUF1775 domain-containing protein [soil metagenome]